MKAALLAAFARATGLAEARLKPAYARLQLWGAAVPLTTTDAPCVFDTGELCCMRRSPATRRLTPQLQCSSKSEQAVSSCLTLLGACC